MNVEDEIRRIVGVDQTEAAMRNMADMIAVYWKTLVEQGLPHADATELTRPLVITMLVGNPE